MGDTDTDDNVEDLPGEDEEEVLEEEIYDSATFLSGPRESESYSYGFTSRKYFNLAMPDPDHLIFTAGNIIHIFDVGTSEMTFRRTAQGGGIGNIRMNPNLEYKHLAVAENGNKFGARPLVVIYEWPSLDINCVLKGGSTASFSNLDYSPDGMLLVSQAGEPDYLITIYDWPRHTILLRTKSYVNDVYRVKFSDSVPGQLCSGGVAHIKFWKMCNTFTGLKLKGEVGRFGKTEYTDIVGVIPMPDEKVVSGCMWGNLLLWEAGLIKVEVMRNNRKPLHEKQIVQIYYLEGELWTVSQDGHVKVWWYEKIDQADPPEDDRVVMLEPSYDFHTPGAMWMCIVKRYKHDLESYQYFAQDGNGGIWLIDCNVYETPEESQRLVRCHASNVMDLASSPCKHFFTTLGAGGSLFAYNYLKKKKVFEHKFSAAGSCMLWLPPTIVPSADEILVAFDDGNIRVCLLDLQENEEDITFSIIQVIKPHSEPLTCMSLNPTGNVLVSGGADYTVFIFKVEVKKECAFLIPIGFITSPDIPNCIVWKPDKPTVMTVGCLRGSFMEADVPTEPQFYTTVSYHLKLKTKNRKFTTYKSQIRRDIEIAIIEAKKAVKREKKRVEMEKLKEDNPGLEIDEENFLADSESSIKWDPLYIPETPGDILWMQYTPDDTLWLSMSGYDAGYIYEYHIDQKDDIPLRFQMIADADDVEISSFIYNYNKRYLVFGMQDGTIRFNKVNPSDWRDQGDYWTLAMHENLNGHIPKMAFSYDEKYFFSCGQDGNVFAYTFHPEFRDYKPGGLIPKASPRKQMIPAVEDDDNQDALSLEQAMIKAENDRINRVAEQNKKDYRSQIAILRERYEALLMRNAALPESQRIKKDHLEIDPRVTEALHIQLERKVALVRRKMAYELSKADTLLKKLRAYYLERVDYFPLTVTAMVKETQISSLRQKRMAQILYNMHAYIDIKILEADMKGRTVERAAAVAKAKAVKKKKAKELEYFLLTLSQSTLDMRLDAKFTRLLNKYRTRKAKWESRQDQWEDFMALQPVEGLDHPDDVAALSYAEKNIGDFKLKTSANYKVADPKDRETTLKKFRQIMIGRRKQFNIRHKFSEKVYSLRDQKEEVRQQLVKYQKKLKSIHEELPAATRKEGPQIPAQKETEQPEKQFQVVIQDDDSEFADEHMLAPKEHTQRFVEEPDIDAAEREVILGMDKVLNMDNLYQEAVYLERSKEACSATFAECLKLSRKEFTPWEMEIRAFRLKRMLFEQEDLIGKMNDAMDDFDDNLKNLNNERSQAQVDGFFCDLYLHKLHQELTILRDFESHEEILQEKVNAKTTNVLDMEDEIGEIKSQIETKNQSIEKNLEQQALIHEQFNKMIHDHKFFDFLRKVFRKKYKPPKVRHSEDSSSESSSSSSSESEEEDDTGSIDSRDFGFIKQDMNVCPKGCEQEIFDNTIALRSERHQLEIGVRDCQREIEGLKKDQELSMKKLKIMNASLQTSQEELASYQREKQEKLNEVECTVILNLDQVQNLKEPGMKWPISECLLFSKTELSKLYKRVGELQTETLKLKTRHLVDVKHLARMKTDLKYMRNEIHSLKQSIIDLVKLKFGKILKMDVIDEHLEKKTFGDDIVNELMEVMFRKMVHDLRMSLADVKTLYKDEMRLWEKKLEKTEREYVEALKENTARMDLLSLLKKEKTQLQNDIANQDKKREIVTKKNALSLEMKDEMKNLKEILKQQENDIEIMKNEIRLLKSKSRFPPGKKEEEFKADDARKEAFQDIEHARDYLYPELLAADVSLSDMELPTLRSEDGKRDRDETIRTIVNSIMENFEVKMDQRSLENFIEATIMPMVDYASVNEIIKEIVDKIGAEPTEEQLDEVLSKIELLSIGSVGSINEGNLWMKEPTKAPQVSAMSPEEIKLYVGTILDDILKDMMSQTEEFKYHISLCNIMMRAVEEIPIEVLKRAEAADVISEKLSSCSCFSKDSIDKVNMAEVIQVWEECLCGSKDTIDKVELGEVEIDWEDKHAPVRRVVDELLNRVFATGLDIIIFHR